MRSASLVLIGIAAALAGCVSFPQSSAEFRTMASGTRTFTADLSLRDAYELVAANTIRCHQGDTEQMAMVGGSFFVFPTGSTRVEGKIDQPGRSATVTVNYFNQTGGGLLQVIDFAYLDASRTSVVVYRLNDTKKWMTATRSVEGWFSGNDDCYDL